MKAQAAKLIVLVAVCFGMVATQAEATANDNSLYAYGIYCTTSGPVKRSIGCTLVSGRGYSVVISNRSVGVAKNSSGDFVYLHKQ